MALQAARQLSIGQWLGAIGAMLGVVWMILVLVVPVLNLILNPEPGIGIYIALPFMISFMSIPGILLVVFGARLVAQRNEVRITRFVGASSFMVSILIGTELGSLVERIVPMTSENFLTTFFTGLIGISSYVAGSRLLLRAEGFDARSTRLFGLITTLIVFLLAADVFGLFADLFDSSILRDLAIRIGVDRPMLELPLIVAGLFTACVFFMVAMRLLRAVDAPRVIPDHTVSFARKA